MDYAPSEKGFGSTEKRAGHGMSADQIDVLGDSALLSGLILVVIALFLVVAAFRPVGKMHYLEQAYEGLGAGGQEWLNYVRIDDTLQTLLVFGGILLTAAFCQVFFRKNNTMARYAMFAIVAVLSLFLMALRYLAPTYIRFFFVSLALLYVAFGAMTAYLAYKLFRADKYIGMGALALVVLLFLAMAVGAVTVVINYDPALVTNNGTINFPML